ncbi:GNAT family N-acetyltransferase [Donghicola mangrovi]|uniref:GNAT family N-acetyltransferase n=1 Tax=Donghicola mangrovi TaxID=2729614 RepID=A0A850Q6A7_9RHOB|nr:GNAT family N-acetyltransferase [Donghicola mangrovi]NVO24474.1 GNAT family N-acetyltransferase [Donghicola mangrovi]
MTKAPTITTARLTLRGFELGDFPVFSAFYASERSKYCGGPAHPESSWRMLACEIGHWQLRGYGRWAVTLTETGELIGNVGLWNPEGWPEPEIGWDIYEGFEGKGYATEAATAARTHAYDVLGWDTVVSLIMPPNEASKTVARKMGAKFERMFDHVRYGQEEIWRHLSAADLMDGGMEAYA